MSRVRIRTNTCMISFFFFSSAFWRTAFTPKNRGPSHFYICCVCSPPPPPPTREYKLHCKHPSCDSGHLHGDTDPIFLICNVLKKYTSVWECRSLLPPAYATRAKYIHPHVTYPQCTPKQMMQKNAKLKQFRGHLELIKDGGSYKST